MTFLGEPVTAYGHTIVSDEFGKTSGYDPALTAETIRAVNVWMATVQSLYDAVALCDGGDDPEFEEGTIVSPVDMAAAFWFGNHPGDDDDGGGGALEDTSMGGNGNGTMYAWAER